MKFKFGVVLLLQCFCFPRLFASQVPVQLAAGKCHKAEDNFAQTDLYQAHFQFFSRVVVQDYYLRTFAVQSA